MDAERWKRVDDLLQSVLAVPDDQQEEFLRQACAGDAGLEQEVQSLLSSHRKLGDFLQPPVLPVLPAQLLSTVSHATGHEVNDDPRLGQTMSHYRVLRRLGRGGMGMVYEAEDLRLGRHVALKLLLDSESGSSKALMRFQQEARAISSLNHPHICTLYEVEEHEGKPVIVMELLQGETLKQRLKAGRVPMLQLLQWGTEVADALEAAHAAGLLHRDIKPANIFISQRGSAKVLDFGLAKLSPSMGGGSSGVDEESLTSMGVIPGTTPYMSPEQARGEDLDGRTDVFSFGVVLYEMATGNQSFAEKNLALTLDAVLHRQPPSPRTINPEVPPELERIIEKTLEKERERRYPSAAALHTDLRQLWHATDSGVVRAYPSERALSEAKWKYVVVALCIGVLLASVGAYRFWPRVNAPISPGKTLQISHWNKVMRNARLSPDGHTVAFTSPVSGIFQVFVMLSSGGEPLQLTSEEGDKMVQAFSANGTEIYYSRLVGSSDIWAVPTLGGNPTRVVRASLIAPSPDGRSLFYTSQKDHAVFRSAPSGLNAEQIFKFDETVTPLALLPFPSGEDLLIVEIVANEDAGRLKRIRVADHTADDLGTMPLANGITWDQPGKSLLCDRTVNGIQNIWRYDLTRRTVSQVTFGSGPDTWPMADPNGKGIYYINGKSAGYLTAYNTHTKQYKDIVDEDASQPAISPDGKRIIYVLLTGPHRQELWISDLDGRNKAKLASAEVLATGLWAHDSSQLSFGDFSSGPVNLYLAGADGSNVQQVPWNGLYVPSMTFSGDGKSLFVSSVKSRQSEVQTWKMNLDGSNLHVIVEGCGEVEDASADDKYLLAVESRGDWLGIYQVSTSDGKCSKLAPGVATFSAVFAPDQKSFLYAVARQGSATIYRQPWRDGQLTGPPQVAYKVPFAFSVNYAGNGYDFSRDLSTIVYARPGGQQDLCLLTEK